MSTLRYYHFVYRGLDTHVVTVHADTLADAIDKWIEKDPAVDGRFLAYGEILVCRAKPIFPNLLPKWIDHPVYQIPA